MTQSLRVGLVQMTSGSDVAANMAAAEDYIRDAQGRGAELVLTPEVTPLMTHDREFLLRTVQDEKNDIALARFRALARELGLWLIIGSIAVKGHGGKVANRSFVVTPDGAIAARYDKIHLFDVNLGEGRSYRESATYEGGRTGEIVATPWGRIGLSICYDIRFPQLYRAYAKAGATILTAPSAFTSWTGQAHWHVLLRARAIETGCFVLAPAQVGDHGGGRLTFGHSLVVNPWGEIVADAGDAPGAVVADIDLGEVAAARAKIPALGHDTEFEIRTNDSL